MVLVAGQNDAGGLSRASGQSCEASKLSSGGFAGSNRMPMASMIDRTDSSVIASSPVWSPGRSTGRSPRRWPISRMSIDAHADGPSVNPNWNAESRSNAEPCSSTPASGSPSLSSGSRNAITAASTLLRPSPVDSVKRGELPSATQRM